MARQVEALRWLEADAGVRAYAAVIDPAAAALPAIGCAPGRRMGALRTLHASPGITVNSA
jgi:hypothetical protein